VFPDREAKKIETTTEFDFQQKNTAKIGWNLKPLTSLQLLPKKTKGKEIHHQSDARPT